MKPTWVVQSNLGKTDDIEAIGHACVGLDQGYLPVKAIPFSDEVPHVDVEGPVIFYGATRFVTTALKSGKWAPCA